jgi:hypothetical protein
LHFSLTQAWMAWLCQEVCKLWLLVARRDDVWVPESQGFSLSRADGKGKQLGWLRAGLGVCSMVPWYFPQRPLRAGMTPGLGRWRRPGRPLGAPGSLRGGLRGGLRCCPCSPRAGAAVCAAALPEAGLPRAAWKLMGSVRTRGVNVENWDKPWEKWNYLGLKHGLYNKPWIMAL